MSVYIGIDPGKTGGLVGLVDYTDLGQKVHMMKSEHATERDVSDWLDSIADGRTSCAVIERVSSSPQMGVTSAFTFGRSYGFLRGALAGAKIPYIEITPQKWQKAMGCLSKGDKNITKSRAQQLYPSEKITHAVADALLLATYCRRFKDELF